MEIKQEIRRAYNEVLNRDPDEKGLNSYIKKIEEGSITLGDLRKILENSEECIQMGENKVPIDLSNPPKKLNLGCGFDKRKGYLNVDFQDFHKPDLVADIKNLSMLQSEYFEEIIAQDVLEHFPRDETIKVLKEWSRLLKKGGILKLRLPNLIGLLSLFLDKKFQNIEKQNLLVHNLFGTQKYTGDWHFTGFTKIILDDFFEKAGFEQQKYQEKDGWLYDITTIKS